jgi:TM2 domain-containing membrane protein YozV
MIRYNFSEKTSRNRREGASLSRVVMAVVLSFLCPGLGQIYNREHRKGWIIIILMMFVIIVPSFWLMQSVGPSLEGMDQLEIQSAMGKVVTDNRHTLNMVTFGFLGLWAYSITQAYFRAKEISRNEAPAPDGE